MNRVRNILLPLAMLMLMASVASAGVFTPRIDRREARQDIRIREGVRGGELTRGEALRLRAGELRIRRMELRAKADGYVGPRERARMNRALNRESRRIHRLEHNGREI